MTDNTHTLKLLFLVLILGNLIPNKVVAQTNTDSLNGYLFAYFEGSGEPSKQEHLRFACSSDALNWSALNGNQPIIDAKDISTTGGIRDPHILRGAEANSYYLVATDMNTHQNGWDNNPGIIMMHSKNLVDWNHSLIDLEKLYPKKFGNVKWVWAPQTIYDPNVGKYLVYFTVRYHHNSNLDFYAAYANKDFSGFEEEPTLLFSPKYGGIDGDIIVKDGVYHLFFKGNTKDMQGNEFKNGIQQATSNSLWGPYVENFEYLDAYADTDTVVEGSSVFKLNGQNEYLLMYDLYANGRYEFQRSKDLNTFSDKPEQFYKNFHPRHGSVIGITPEEARALSNKWSGVPDQLVAP